MATYVIGDIHGCFQTFQALLDRIGFSQKQDHLWMVGDLVNGGPSSLETLRWARDRGRSVTAVLGNHDLYLLGRATGACKRKKRDTLDPILRAHDRVELIDWLRHRPLIVSDSNRLLLHAGLLPEWSTERALGLARETELLLRRAAGAEVLARLFARKPDRWTESKEPLERACQVLQVLTYLRTCREDGRPCSEFTGPPEEAPRGCRPWYSYPARQNDSVTYYFGHWAALGLFRSDNLVALDTGCVWGGSLTALRLEDGVVFQEARLDPE